MNLHDQDTFLRGKNEGIQQGRSEGIVQGRFEGSQQAKIETAKNFLAMGLNIEQVVKGTGLPEETIIELAKK